MGEDLSEFFIQSAEETVDDGRGSGGVPGEEDRDDRGGERRERREEAAYPETPLDFHLAINDVSANKFSLNGRDFVDDLLRDYSNANLDKFELAQIRLYNDLLMIVRDVGAVGKDSSEELILRRIFAMLASSKSKNGFERKMTVSQFTHGTMQSNQNIRESSGSRFLMFGKKKRSGMNRFIPPEEGGGY